ncbi:Caudovirus prohead protease [compost metagenome]
MSFGFYVRSDAWQYLKDEDVYERTLLDVNLFEVSPTPFPAYQESEVNQRSMKEYGVSTKEQRRFEKDNLLLEIDQLGLSLTI